VAQRETFGVVIPNFNHTRFLAGAIESVLAQEPAPDEIIVVDDGSSDGCESVVARFGTRVRGIRQENQGLAGARNTGIRAGATDLVGLLDADDRWRPGFCLAMGRLLAVNRDAAAGFCRAQATDENGETLPQVLGGGPVRPADIHQQLLRANFIIPSTVVLRRSALLAAGLFDASLRSCEDWDLWLRLLPRRRLVEHRATLVDYRVHGGSLSGDPEAMQYWTRQVVERRFGKEDGPPESWPAEKRRAVGGLYRYCAISSVQRRQDWGRAAGFLRRALHSDPTLSDDLDLFYELALAGQPVGYRGAAAPEVLDHGHRFSSMIELAFSEPADGVDRRRGLGTAYKALGLVAYHAGRFGLSREYLSRALGHDVRLWRDPLVMSDLAKSVFREWLAPPALSRPGGTA
jgi:glycosyltransferase involved in cell wall biosynthesis